MTSLTGQLLIAMPQMSDPFFEHSVVYLCSHSPEDGAMGLVVNKAIATLTVEELYEQLMIEPVAHASRPQRVHFGGPVAPGQGFVLHSPDYREEGTLGLGEDFAMTATIDILRATGMGTGPRRSLVALGYAGWGPGQLDAEIQANGWLSSPAEPELIFDTPAASRYDRVMGKLGIDPAMLSNVAGRA